MPVDITEPNFVKITRFNAEILQFFEFLRWPSPPSWIFEIMKFYWLARSRWPRRIIVPNFVKIGQSAVKIFQFVNFLIWRPRDILARILADTSDTRDFLKLFLSQAERHTDILATIIAKMSARMSVSVSASWNAGFTERRGLNHEEQFQITFI